MKSYLVIVFLVVGLALCVIFLPIKFSKTMITATASPSASPSAIGYNCADVVITPNSTNLHVHCDL
jgi:hypothetical protein